MEPTIGLEPMTCRLRKDPALRMLLCNKERLVGIPGRFGLFRESVVQQFVQQNFRANWINVRIPVLRFTAVGLRVDLMT